ncbi:methyltransferase domain-containing protein [Mesorhizobium sp. M0500]|uniref:methyltransferase domain-containing protein n=1 Tax=Mesorhizobium sp. M0500 TaxID=2956953 RepID=UPI0033354529
MYGKIADEVERRLATFGFRIATWDDARSCGKLYAGRLTRNLPQFDTHIGLTPYSPSPRNINHDVTQPMPLRECIDIYQSEDVFEHVAYEKLPQIFAHIHTVLKPGGLFRMSVPDYRFDVYRDRSVQDGDRFVFDPVGGGRYENGVVTGGGHLWFPTYESVTALAAASPFSKWEVLEGYDPDGNAIIKPVDESYGRVLRTSYRDPRVASRPRPLSMIMDLWK